MPISKYDKQFGGKPGSAQEAKDAMAKQYGPDKGKRVFYATAAKNAKKKRGAAKGGIADRLAGKRRGGDPDAGMERGEKGGGAAEERAEMRSKRRK